MVQTARQAPLASLEHRTGRRKGLEVLGAIGDVLKLYFGAWDVDPPKAACRAHLSPREAAAIDVLLMGLPRT